jgi:hypothetical protein
LCLGSGVGVLGLVVGLFGWVGEYGVFFWLHSRAGFGMGGGGLDMFGK